MLLGREIIFCMKYLFCNLVAFILLSFLCVLRSQKFAYFSKEGRFGERLSMVAFIISDITGAKHSLQVLDPLMP